MAVSQKIIFTQVSQSIQNNTSQVKIQWTSTQTGDSRNNYTSTAYYYISVNGGQETEHSVTYTLPQGTTKTIAETTVTVPHLADGSASVTVRTVMDTGISAGVIKLNETFSPDTIPRPSTLTVSDGTLGTRQTLTIERAASTFKHRLTYRCGDVADYIAGSLTSYTTGTIIIWTPPLGLAAENTTGTSVLVDLTLYTYTENGEHVGTTTKTITCVIPASVKPSCSIEVGDVSGLLTKLGAAVQGLSQLEITVTANTAQGSLITSYEINANGAKYNSDTATTEPLTTPGENVITATVKDERGRSGSASYTLDVLAYTAPVVSSLTVHRCDVDGVENDQGNYVQVNFSAAVSDLGGRNSASYRLRYKLSTASIYTEVKLSNLDNVYAVGGFSFVFEADGSSSYDVEVVAQDDYGTATRMTSASTAFTLMNWNAEGDGMGIGKVAERSRGLDMGLDIYMNKNNIYDAEGNAVGNPKGYTPDNIVHCSTDDELLAAMDECYEMTANGKMQFCTFSVDTVGMALTDGMKFMTFYRTDNSWGRAEARDYYSACTLVNLRRNGQWQGWQSDTLAAYPIGSIYLHYDHTDPAEMFGGTWVRISNYILRGVAEGGEIGELGTLADGSGRTYINIAIWRRTA